ncbi:MAG: PEP/pyruvate-binding domain-containing protein [candidate division Zixibacteria bacterium]
MDKTENQRLGNGGNSNSDLRTIQKNFALFLQLLEQNNHILGIMGDMGEKSQGEYLFDIHYIRECLTEIRGGITLIINKMVALGGPEYEALRVRFNEIDAVLGTVLPGQQPIKKDSLTVSFDRLNRNRAYSVGSKNAQLGEMKARLNMPVPEGFAITARAYKHFVDANDLQVRISRRIDSLDIKSYDDLVRIGGEIREMINASPVPLDLVSSILQSYRELIMRTSHGMISMRSSAIGEDTLFSFAGQYASYLNVREEELINRYREILASKFTPQAIYYFLSHSLSEAELAMSVGCVSMIDAKASGVVYSRDPIDPRDDSIIVNSIFGLGKYLVNGRLTPDEFRLSRDTGRILYSRIAKKPARLVNLPEGGTLKEDIPEEEQRKFSIAEPHLQELREYALKLEKHYRMPQDIEWVIDKNDKLFLLQSRPLQIIRLKSEAVQLDTTRKKKILTGRTTVCPGAGSGPVYHVSTFSDLPDIPEGAVLVTHHPFPGLITVMSKVSAIVSRIGGLASHMATIAREYHVPTLAGVPEYKNLKSGHIVTVDATEKAIYAGKHEDIVKARQPEYDLFEDSGIHRVLDKVLDLVTPLRLLHPADEDFLPENCMSFHDITRFAHQKAMEEMFRRAQEMESKESLGYKLKSDLPVDMSVIYLERELLSDVKERYVTEEDINATPMKNFWAGIKEEGWPVKPPLPVFTKGLGTDLTLKTNKDYSEYSFTVLGREYMMLSLRLGYHFTTVEVMRTDETGNNYIHMQYKDGGATLDRRIRRIKLLKDILSHMGFTQQRKGDFLNAGISYQDKQVIDEKLFLLGRLTMKTKQLDMALSNDAVAEWYTQDFIKKLGLE